MSTSANLSRTEEEVRHLDQLSDPQLVIAIATSGQAALAEIYRRHAAAVFGLARRVAGIDSEAEDITQEVFLALWARPERFDAARGSLRTFLLTTTHGRAVDLVRSRTARTTRERRNSVQQASTGCDFDREVDGVGVADELSHALAGLPDEERTAIELAYFEGHTYREVARILCQPEGTIKTRIRNGLKAMKQDLHGLAGRKVGRQ